MRIPLNTSSRDIYGIARDILVNKTRFMDLKQGNVTGESYRFKYSKNKPVFGKAKIGFVVYPIGFKLSLSDRHDLQNAILADAFKNNKPKLKGVALSGGYYYPYIRHEEDETYSVFDKCKSISEAKSLLAKGIEYNDALRRKNNGYSNGLRSRTNAVITNNGSALEKSETTNTVRLDSETEKIADTKADNSTNRENNSKQPQFSKLDLNDEEIKKIKPDELINPNYIQPIYEIEIEDKYNYLVKDFEENGWNGRPLVAYKINDQEYIALTGSHRIYAAREAGVEIPVVIITEDNIKNEDDAELLSSLLEANRNDERFNIAFDLYEKGLISKSAKDLIAREEDLTYDYYENIEEAPRFSVVQDEKLLDELEKGETVTIGDEVDATGFDEYLEERVKEEGITSKEDIN